MPGKPFAARGSPGSRQGATRVPRECRKGPRGATRRQAAASARRQGHQPARPRLVNRCRHASGVAEHRANPCPPVRVPGNRLSMPFSAAGNGTRGTTLASNRLSMRRAAAPGATRVPRDGTRMPCGGQNVPNGAKRGHRQPGGHLYAPPRALAGQARFGHRRRHALGVAEHGRTQVPLSGSRVARSQTSTRLCATRAKVTASTSAAPLKSGSTKNGAPIS